MRVAFSKDHKAGNHEEQIDADAKRRHRQPEGDHGIVAVDERDMRYDHRRNREAAQLIEGYEPSLRHRRPRGDLYLHICIYVYALL